MAPLIPIFDASALPEHVNFTTKNFQPKLRKGTPVELEKCPLFEMEQFACHAPATVGGRPVCLPVIRLFRRFVLSFFLLALFGMLY